MTEAPLSIQSHQSASNGDGNGGSSLHGRVSALEAELKYLATKEDVQHVDASVQRLEASINASIQRVEASINASIQRVEASVDASIQRAIASHTKWLSEKILDFSKQLMIMQRWLIGFFVSAAIGTAVIVTRAFL